MPDNPLTPEVDNFILDQIETVPHLEALLLVWNKRPKSWSPQEIAKALYVPEDLAASLLRELAQKSLLREVAAPAIAYEYNSGSQQRDNLLAAVDATYRRELIRISRMIHAKAPSALRQFARAFRMTKKREKE